jgi:hypothetical protein
MDYNDDELVYSVSGGENDRSVSETDTAVPMGDVVTTINCENNNLAL